MDIDMIVNVIQTLGFPIAVCIALFWYVNKQTETHKEEMDGLRKTIEENTVILSQLKELINIIVKKNDN